MTLLEKEFLETTHLSRDTLLRRISALGSTALQHKENIMSSGRLDALEEMALALAVVSLSLAPSDACVASRTQRAAERVADLMKLSLGA